MAARFKNRLSSGRFGTVSARNLSNIARLHEGYQQWSRKRNLEAAVENNSPGKRFTRSALVRTGETNSKISILLHGLQISKFFLFFLTGKRRT